MVTSKAKNNDWCRVRNQSLAVYARNAGYDLSIYHEYEPLVREALKKRTIAEAMKSISGICEKKGFDFENVRSGVYVIAIANPLSISYQKNRSQVLYIGCGSIYHRIKHHFNSKLFDFMLSVSGSNFDFYFAQAIRGDEAEYFNQVEFWMIDWFSQKHREGEQTPQLPLMNKNIGVDKDLPDDDGWWAKPLKESGKKPLWEMKPTNFSEFQLE